MAFVHHLSNEVIISLRSALGSPELSHEFRWGTSKRCSLAGSSGCYGNVGK